MYGGSAIHVSQHGSPLQVLIAVIDRRRLYVLHDRSIRGATLLPPFFFSNPVDVAARVVKWFADATIWKKIPWSPSTLIEAMLAFVIGSVAGVLVGFWFAQQPRVAAVFDPYVKMSTRCRAWCWRRSSRCGSDSASVEGRARRHARILHRVLQPIRASRR